MTNRQILAKEMGIDLEKLSEKSANFSIFMAAQMLDGDVNDILLYNYIVENFNEKERVLLSLAYLQEKTEEIFEEYAKSPQFP